MTNPDLRLDIRNPMAALFYSCCDSHPLGFDLLKGPTAILQRCLLASEVPPSLDDDVHVLRIQLDAVTCTSGQFGGDEGSARSQEGIVYRAATLGVIEDRAAHQLNRFLCRMVALL